MKNKQAISLVKTSTESTSTVEMHLGAMIFHPVQPGVIWSQLEESFERALSMDPDAFEEADLEVLKERPWQQMWNMYLQDLVLFGGRCLGEVQVLC